MSGFYYPNEVEIQWSILIVLYPFITGLVAGAFVVSALYHVFGVQQLKPVSRFSLLTALAFLLVAPLPLQAHLGHPERGVEIFITPHFTSAMSGFGYIWLFYFLLVSIEVWLLFRRDIAFYAQTAGGLRGLLFSVLSLGVTEIDEEGLEMDHRIAKVLATIGVPAASFLHGYVGFIFGGIKANPWWSTPLMPFIFLLSAVVSGVSLLTILYIVTSKMRGVEVDDDCLASLTGWLFGFLMMDIALEGVELLSMAYDSEESWEVVRHLITHQLAISFLFIQLFMGAFVPLVILATMQIMRPGRAVQTAMSFLAATFVLIGVFAMRWNVVIGGQMISKSLRGFLEYNPPIFGQEGLAVAGVLLVMPLVILSVLLFLLPPWVEPDELELEEEEPPWGTWEVEVPRARYQ